MAQKAPGKHYRKGLSLIDLFDRFPDDATAENWFVEQRWPDGIRCAHCDSDKVTIRGSHPTMPYRCRSCRKFFSAKTNSVMHSSKLGYRKWALAIYILTTNIKGTSSMKLHRDLGITQKAAWHMMHRIRETWAEHPVSFASVVEVDETYMGGKETNKHQSKRLKTRGRGVAGKTPVVGAKDRLTNQVIAQPIEGADSISLNYFVTANTAPEAIIYTDEWKGYNHLPRIREAVKHSAKQYVDGMVHTNGMESFWAMLKRGYVGTYHKLSVKHLDRYVNEFAGRHNQRPLDTIDQMAAMARGMDGKRLRYEDLIGPRETRQPKMF